MGRGCTVLAHVRNITGNVVESNLFKDLLHYTGNNRELTKEYYAVGTNEEFLSKVRDKEEYEEDENGEITFRSLKNLAKIDLATDKLIDTLNKDIHSGKYSYEDAIKKVQYFNENNIFSEKVLAIMTDIGKGQYFVSVVPTSKTVTDEKEKEKKEAVNTNEREQLHKTVRNKELEKRLIDLLKRHKVSVKFLEGGREGGRYSTENIVNAENGLYALIDIIAGEHTTENLAEEAGHFAIGALGDYPLVRRLESLLSDEKAQIEAIGQERYDRELLGNNPAREVAGKLVGKALMRNLGKGKTVFNLANRIANLAKRVFYNIRGNEVRWAAAKAEQIANKIAYQFVGGNSNFSVQNAIDIVETMNNATKSANVEGYQKLINEMGSLCKRLDAIANDKLSGQMQASMAFTAISGADSSGKTALEYANEHLDAMADNLAFDGIVQALMQITDYLGNGAQIDSLMKAVNLKNPSEFFSNMARNARYLRQARTFLDSAEYMLHIASERINDNNEGGTIKVTNGTSLKDVRYQDEEGTWHTVNLETLIHSYTALVNRKSIDLGVLEQAYFARFCENIYGSKYVNTTVGLLWKDIWHGNTGTNEEKSLSISDMVLGRGFHDIDMYHRFIGSMSNNPDIIGQIVDKMTKICNKQADDLTARYQEKLAILKERADKLGLKVEDLVELDDEGHPTGNFITPPAAPTKNGNMEEDFICKAYMADLGTDNASDVYAVSWGTWEKARDEFKKQEWENFKSLNPNWQSMSNLARGLAWQEHIRTKMKDWNKANSIKVKCIDSEGNKYIKWVPNMIYKSDTWDNLKAKYPHTKNNDNISRWVSDYMEIKHELDSFLPGGSTVFYRMPQFRGTFNNTVRNKANFFETGHYKKARSWMKTFGRRGILESFVETADDTDYGDMTSMNNPDEELLGTKLDYELEKANRLPIFGVNKLKNMQDLSTDIFGSTLAYASMATTYGCMSNIVDALEVGKNALFQREFTEANWVNKAETKIGTFVEGKVSSAHKVKMEGHKDLAYTRYLKFLDKQVYGIGGTKWGFTFKNGNRILLNKLLQNLSSLAGSMFLKGNVLGGAVNTATGFNNIFKEASVGEYFGMKDWAFAHKYYYSSFGKMWMEAGSLRKTSKLDLFLYRMNSLSDNKERFRNWHTNRNWMNNFYRKLGYFPYSAGDHYMQAMSYLSVAHGTKLYDEHGKLSTNLWDAFKKKDNTDDYDEYKKGKTLDFEKLCPIDASEITSDALDSQGVYLKKMSRSKSDFLTWLYAQDVQFKDEGYLSQHRDEYDNYRSQFAKKSDQELVDFQASQYQTLKSILKKVETYLSSTPSPLTGAPVAPTFTQAEQDYLNVKGLGTGEYKNIIQAVQEDIYNTIWTKRDESQYMDRCREINNRLHGIYNQQDKTAFHNNIFGNAFLAMKGWALGYLEQMWSGNHHSIALGRNVEGFVNTALKVPASVIVGKIMGRKSMSITDMMLTMLIPWTKRSKKAMLQAGFSENQYYNTKRMGMALVLISSIGMLFLMLKLHHDEAKDDDAEDELSVYEGLLYYLAYRTMLEQEVFIEASTTFIESGSLLDAVPTGVAALADLTNLIWQGVGALVTDEDNANFYYQSNEAHGRYEEGDAKFWNHLYRLIPYYKSVWNIEHPYEAVDNYEFGRKMRTR